MKDIKMLKKPLIHIIMICVLASLCIFSVSAETEPEETYAIESYATEWYDDTEPEPYETQEPTEPDTTGASQTQEATEPTETKPAVTYKEPLPEIASEEIVIPSVIGEIKEENEPSMFWGFVSWICVGVGLAVILAVLLTTKTRAYRGGGKMRYSTGDKISGKKRLLNDKYYNDNKHR